MRTIVRALLLLVSAVTVSTAFSASPPEWETPPADAQTFVILSLSSVHGSAVVWRRVDGAIVSRQSLLLRGMATEIEQTIELAPNGVPERIVVRGFSPRGPVSETFSVRDGVASWETSLDSGSMPYNGSAQYVPLHRTWADEVYWARSLHEAPGRTLPVLPRGARQMSKLTDIAIGHGAMARTVTAWLVEGLTLDPEVVLMNRDGTFFGAVGGTVGGTAGGLALLPEAYTSEVARIEQAQNDALAARERVVRHRFGGVPAIPVAFTHVKLFDSTTARFIDDQTVIAQGGGIVAVGPAASVKPPANARVIDGHRKTLTPGIWDAHMHVATDRQGVMLMSLGVTSARNPGASVKSTMERAARIARGEMLSPTVYSSVIIDGAGPFAAQGSIAVSSEQQAIDTVRMVKSRGFSGVKFYGSIRPEWLAPAATEAHRLGLHVHGHVPATLRPADAIRAGYDEITHINMVLMQAMPDSVVDVSNTLARIEGPARYGKDVDLYAEPMKSLIELMLRERTIVDPTLAALEKVYIGENGEVQPAFAPFIDIVPPATARSFRAGGFKPPAGATRADWRASFAKMLELTKLLHDAGVPIVAGTDGNGLEIVRELELYVAAGLTPGEALRTATIEAARLVGAEQFTGSITVGKQADLVLIDGDPSRSIGDLRRTQWVMNDGVLMSADELREAAGFVASRQ